MEGRRPRRIVAEFDPDDVVVLPEDEGEEEETEEFYAVLSRPQRLQTAPTSLSPPRLVGGGADVASEIRPTVDLSGGFFFVDAVCIYVHPSNEERRNLTPKP